MQQPPANLHEATTLTDIPVLYPKLSWQKSTAKPTLSAGYITYGGKNVILSGGQEWSAQKMNITYAELGKSVLDFHGYYDPRFSAMGWFDWQGVTINGTRLEILAANGPMGEIWGYVGVKGSKFRVVLFKQEYISLKPEANTPSCPNCYPKYTIYLSDILSLSEISTLFETTK